MLKIPFRVIIPNTDETLTSAIDLEQIPELIAREKVTAVIHSLPAGQEIPWILGADTVIFFNGKILGKPASQRPGFNIDVGSIGGTVAAHLRIGQRSELYGELAIMLSGSSGDVCSEFAVAHALEGNGTGISSAGGHVHIIFLGGS